MPAVPETHVVLHDISWETYESLLADLEHRRLRLTYDSGVLEIMSPSQSHERSRHLTSRMIEAATEELGIPIAGGGATTWRRKDLAKGLEADECYWVQNEARVRGRDDVDLLVDPPPDLALEVDIHSSSLDRFPIYSALGVPEIWRFKDEKITVLLRQDDGSYQPSSRSSCFPWLPMDELMAWLGRSVGRDETSFIREFRAWVHASIQTD